MAGINHMLSFPKDHRFLTLRALRHVRNQAGNERLCVKAFHDVEEVTRQAHSSRNKGVSMSERYFLQCTNTQKIMEKIGKEIHLSTMEPNRNITEILKFKVFKNHQDSCTSPSYNERQPAAALMTTG